MQEEWISTKEAADLLDVVPDHVALLGKQGRLIRRKIDGRTYLYSKQSVESYRDQRQNKGIRALKNKQQSDIE